MDQQQSTTRSSSHTCFAHVYFAIHRRALALLPILHADDAHTMWQDSSPYGASSQNAYYGQQNTSQAVPLQFYAPTPGSDPNGFYPGSRSSLEGSVGAQGSMAANSAGPAYGGSIQPQGGWWTAFGTGGFEGEPPLLEGTSL